MTTRGRISRWLRRHRRPAHMVLKPMVDFSSEIGRRELLAVGVGHDGSIACLVGETPESAASGRQAATAATAVITWDPRTSACRELGVQPIRVAFPIVQPMPSGGALVVSARLSRGDDANAVVVDADGRIRTRILFGDGIEDVQVDQDGKAWVSYMDEGVYR